MPCRSDHMESDQYEIELSKMLCCLDDLNGKKIEKRWLDGYHPEAYCHEISKERMCNTIEMLCSRLKEHKNIDSLSLETQIWWRDHQIADEKREEKENLRVVAIKDLIRLVNELKNPTFYGIPLLEEQLKFLNAELDKAKLST